MQTTKELSKETVYIRTLMERQIRDSMVWKESCKKGRSMFSQDFPVQSEQVLNALFQPVAHEGEKVWRMKRLEKDDFEVLRTIKT